MKTMTEEELKDYIAKNSKINVFAPKADDYECTMLIDGIRIGVFFPKKIVDDFMAEQAHQAMYDTLIQRKIITIETIQ